MVNFISSHSLLVNLSPCLQTLQRIFPFICICLSARARVRRWETIHRAIALLLWDWQPRVATNGDMRRERPLKSALSLQLQVTFLQAWAKQT